MADWYLEQITPPDREPLEVESVRDDHLRAANGSIENVYIERLIRTARRAAERVTRRKLVTQVWEAVTCRFPLGSDAIEIPLAPLQSVDSIAYIDSDGVEQVWGGSPLPYVVRNPSVHSNAPSVIYPAYDVEWPTVRSQRDAVTLTLTVGYPDVGSPPESDIPEDIIHGMLLVIGELYKQRSESVHAFNQNPAVIRARDLWMGYRVY